MVFRVAAGIRAGEWTTYGDVSRAVVGSTGLARYVGTLAASDDGFPNTRRVLGAGGRIARPSPAQERRTLAALEEEGVRFVGKRADVSQKVPWDELARRAGLPPRLRA